MKRRDMITGFGLGAATGMLGLLRPTQDATAEAYAKATNGLPPLKITNVRAILTAPAGIRLCVVKVETSEPGLYGLGCATYNQRPLTVQTAVNEYLRPFAKGRDVDNVEDMWQNAYTSSYWRNGPVLNNGLSGLDQALWDIKGKRAGMPVYQLLGGKCRFAVDCYTHCGGDDLKQIEQSVKAAMGGAFGTSASNGAVTARRTCRSRQISRRRGSGCRSIRTWPSGRTSRARSRCSSTSAAPAATMSNCSTTSTSVSRPSRRSISASSSRNTARSSSRTRSPRRTTATSRSSASRRACPSRWASCSTIRTSGSV
jgi:hypothetical protein